MFSEPTFLSTWVRHILHRPEGLDSSVTLPVASRGSFDLRPNLLDNKVEIIKIIIPPKLKELL